VPVAPVTAPAAPAPEATIALTTRTRPAPLRARTREDAAGVVADDDELAALAE